MLVRAIVISRERSAIMRMSRSYYPFSVSLFLTLVGKHGTHGFSFRPTRLWFVYTVTVTKYLHRPVVSAVNRIRPNEQHTPLPLHLLIRSTLLERRNFFFSVWFERKRKVCVERIDTVNNPSGICWRTSWNSFALLHVFFFIIRIDFSIHRLQLLYVFINTRFDYFIVLGNVYFV